MLRNLLIIALVICFSASASAQNTGSASQTLQLVFQPAMDLQFFNNNSSQQLKVRSNKNFKISVHAAASNLSLKITNNKTGGELNSSFDNNYSSLSSNNQDIVSNALGGDDQVLAFAYKAKGGAKQSEGTFSAGVIYTATQP